MRAVKQTARILGIDASCQAQENSKHGYEMHCKYVVYICGRGLRLDREWCKHLGRYLILASVKSCFVVVVNAPPEEASRDSVQSGVKYMFEAPCHAACGTRQTEREKKRTRELRNKKSRDKLSKPIIKERIVVNHALHRYLIR